MLCEPQRGVREAIVMPKRTELDFAKTMKHLVGLYPQAEVIRLVLDNLNTHTYGAWYEAFPSEEARTLARKLEFHDTPKHGSWLNVAEIELAVLANMCLSPHIPDEETLRREIEANVRERHAKAVKVNWRFATQNARRKLARLYPPVPE